MLASVPWLRGAPGRRSRALGLALLLGAPGAPGACDRPDARAGAWEPDSIAAARESERTGLAARDPSAMADEPRVVLVTGSTDGLGREVARRLGARGDHVIVHGRNEERGTALVREIERSGAGSARFYAADFASLDNVRELAAAIRRDHDRLDVLVNNAGILVSPDERPISEDGHELHFQVNYLAGFLLTRELLPLLRESARARIVNVSSRSDARLDFDDLMLERGYSARRAYGQSKLAQVMFTISLARRLEGTGITVVAVHPATLMNTDLVRDMGMEPRSTVDEGARAVLHAIESDDVEPGEFYHGTSPGRAHPQAHEEEARAELWARSEELVAAAGPGGGEPGTP